MNLRDARKEIMACTAAGNAVILESPSGLGKSQMILQVFDRIKQQEPNVNWGFGVIFAATQTPPDLIGFQFKGEREFPRTSIDPASGEKVTVMQKVTVTDPSVPLWMISTEGKPAFMYDRFFLLIDEYGQGEADVKRAIAEIFLNGGTAPWYLPPGSIRIACTNKGNRYGVTKDFDFCIARRSKIVITGDPDVWIEDFADKPYIYQGKQWLTSPVIKTWARQNPQILFEDEPKEQGPWCNPRTLCAFDRYLQVKAAGNAGQLPTDPITMEVGAGTIGMGATQSIGGFLQFALELPQYADVVADPMKADLPTKADLLMLMAYQMAAYTQIADLAAVITYVQRMPKDMAVTYVSALLRRDYKNIINQPAMQGWINKNAALVSIIASLSQ